MRYLFLEDASQALNAGTDVALETLDAGTDVKSGFHASALGEGGPCGCPADRGLYG